MSLRISTGSLWKGLVSSVHQLQPPSTTAETCESLKITVIKMLFFTVIVTEKFTFAEEHTPMW